MLLKIIAPTLLILAAVAIYLYYPIYIAKKIGGKIVASTVAYEQHPENATQKILVAGDSTAVGVGAINSQDSIAGRLGKQFPQADITNLGVSGDRLQDLLTKLKKHPLGHYDLIVLQIGANDITHFTPAHTVKNEINEILSLATRHASKVILLTSGNIGNAKVFHWPLSTLFTARTLELRSIFMTEASNFKQVYYIDLYRSRENDPFENNIPKYYAPDLFHLTGDGYGVWYEDIQKVL